MKEAVLLKKNAKKAFRNFCGEFQAIKMADRTGARIKEITEGHLKKGGNAYDIRFNRMLIQMIEEFLRNGQFEIVEDDEAPDFPLPAA